MYNVCVLFPLQSITRIIISPRPSSSKPGSYCSSYRNMIMSCYDFYNHLQKCWGGCYFLPLISFFPHPWPNSEQSLNAMIVLVYFKTEWGEWRIFSKRESHHFWSLKWTTVNIYNLTNYWYFWQSGIWISTIIA